MNDAGYLKGACLQCGGPIEFPAHAVGTQTDCPHCGWSTEMQPSDPSLIPAAEIPETPPALKKGAGLWIWIGIAGAILISAAAGAAFYFKWPGLHHSPMGTNAPAPLEIAPVAPIPEGLVISRVKIEPTKGTSLVHARGTVHNRSAQPRYGLKVEVQMLDAQGAALGLGSDYIDVLEPNAQWEFKVLVINPKTARASLHRLTEQE